MFVCQMKGENTKLVVAITTVICMLYMFNIDALESIVTRVTWQWEEREADEDFEATLRYKRRGKRHWMKEWPEYTETNKYKDIYTYI